MAIDFKDYELKYIADHADKFSDIEIARQLSRISARNISDQMVKRARWKLGIGKRPGRRKPKGF